eukprot:12311681-Ditylum_brightwellii.AAC.1
MQTGATFFYCGICSATNQPQSKQWYGLAAPAGYRSVESKLSEDKKFCNITESLIHKCMKGAMPLRGQHLEHLLYLVPTTNAQFLTNRQSPIHASFYAITDENNVLNVHVDSQNPRDLITLPNYIMNQPVGCFGVMHGSTRYVVTAYGCDSVVNASMQYNKYAPFLKCIEDYYKKVPDKRKEVSSCLVEEIFNTLHSETPLRMDVHINKMVFYSPFVDIFSS